MNGNSAYGAAVNKAIEEIEQSKVTDAVNKGTWDASLNSPTIANGTGNNGWYYRVSVAGDWNGVHFLVGDTILYNGTIWQRIPTGIESNGPIPVKYLLNSDTKFPTHRASGAPLIIGDYVGVDSRAQLDFEIEGITISGYDDIVVHIGGGVWQKKAVGIASTSEVSVSDSENESLSGNATYQSVINAENKEAIKNSEKKANKIHSLDDWQSGDLDKYPSAQCLKNEADKKVSTTRKVAGLDLDHDIFINELIETFKDVARVYKNVTFDCDDNTLRNIVLSCFKSDEIFTSMPSTMSVENYKLLTAKGIYDFVRGQVQGAIKIKGKKNTKAEIFALTDMEVNDEWRCEEDNHFWLYTEEDGWIDNGGAIDFSLFVLKTDIIDNCETNDSQKPLSAAQGKMLKELADTKQDKFDLAGKGQELPILNPDITFINRKLNFFMDMTLMNIEANPSAPITNYTSDRKLILKLPTPPQDFSYPSKTRIQLSRPSGYWTCEENRQEFFDSNGTYYVDPANFAKNKSFSLMSVYQYDFNNTYYKDPNQQQVIYVTEQIKNQLGVPVVEKDGTPYVSRVGMSFKIDENGQAEQQQQQQQQKVFVLKYAAGEGYVYKNKIYDASGNEVTGDFYELQEVTLTPNMNFIYQQYIYQKMIEVVGSNFLVDNQGRLCKVEITLDAQSTDLKINCADASYMRYIKGWNGQVVILPINHNATLDETTATIEAHTAPDPEDPSQTIIDYYNLYIHGSNAYSDITIQKAY